MWWPLAGGHIGARYAYGNVRRRTGRVSASGDPHGAHRHAPSVFGPAGVVDMPEVEQEQRSWRLFARIVRAATVLRIGYACGPEPAGYCRGGRAPPCRRRSSGEQLMVRNAPRNRPICGRMHPAYGSGYPARCAPYRGSKGGARRLSVLHATALYCAVLLRTALLDLRCLGALLVRRLAASWFTSESSAFVLMYRAHSMFPGIDSMTLAIVSR